MRRPRRNEMNLLLSADGTAADSLASGSRVISTASATGTTLAASRSVRIRAADLRDQVALLASDIDGVHQEAQDYDLQQRAQIKARSAVPALLSELAVDRGMSWSSVARLIGVSVGAVRKWRNDGAATGENRRAVARLAAFLDLLEEFSVQDPAGWLEMPMVDGYTVTASDLYRARMELELLDFAAVRASVDDVLSKYDQHWRRSYKTNFEVFEAADGNLAVRRRQEDG